MSNEADFGKVRKDAEETAANLDEVKNATSVVEEDEDTVVPTETTDPEVVKLSASATDAEVATAQRAADNAWRSANPGKPLVRASNPRVGGE